ncbi:Photosynthetic NDH subunit of subcomplex B 5, chloroplastic [Linum perenne]
MAAAACLSSASSASLRRITSIQSTPSFTITKSVRLSNVFRNHTIHSSKASTSRLGAAGLSEIEPDLSEEPIDEYRTPGIDPEDFEYGIYDGHHTYFESGEDEGHLINLLSNYWVSSLSFFLLLTAVLIDSGSFWGAIADEIKGVEPPTGFQELNTLVMSEWAGMISWLFLPAMTAGMYFNIPGEILFGGAALFATVFVIIEMDKPDKPHNFEPQIYNMERGARDKLISDYNSMSIWDFNRKYGELWDFTITRNDLSDFGE